jgi:hypothetical protein
MPRLTWAYGDRDPLSLTGGHPDGNRGWGASGAVPGKSGTGVHGGASPMLGPALRQAPRPRLRPGRGRRQPTRDSEVRHPIQVPDKPGTGEEQYDC